MLLLLQAAQNAPPDIVSQTWLTWTAGWVSLGFLGLFGVLILYYVLIGKIDLSGLISEPGGDASMSRFQLLIFTFVIAACLFLIVASAKPQPAFPTIIPQGILILLGISSSSYLVSKGIQAGSKQGLGAAAGPQVTVKGSSSNTTPGGATIQFQAAVVGLTDESVTWAIDPPAGAGSIDANGLYTPPPAAGAAAPAKVVVKAISKEDVSVSDTETISLL